MNFVKSVFLDDLLQSQSVKILSGVIVLLKLCRLCAEHDLVADVELSAHDVPDVHALVEPRLEIGLPQVQPVLEVVEYSAALVDDLDDLPCVVGPALDTINGVHGRGARILDV